VTWIGLFMNLILTGFKFAAGIIGRSGAMVADAVHSVSDLATDLVVLAGLRFSSKPWTGTTPTATGSWKPSRRRSLAPLCWRWPRG
jgi:Co/Zn/Cd efflux system component